MENWRPIPHFPNYEVSNLGRVRVLSGRYAGEILSQVEQANGYQRVYLTNEAGRFGKYVHRLVAEAFLGPCPAGWEVNHRDLDKAHNADVNLEYVTHRANIRHARRRLGNWNWNAPRGAMAND